MMILETYKTQTNQQLSCYLIGHESLLIPCADALLERGHQILGIISTGASITQWTATQEIPCIPPTEDLIHFLSQQPFDYLFSIHNLSILSQEIIDLPRRGAINCHNALLPKYGGLNAASWAIIHQEKNHGITWHQITKLIDGGDIFKQVSIPIAQDETAFTLLSKCYEVVIESFAQLIDEIASNQVTITSQNLENRSYFSREQKPSPGCILSWDQCAYKIEALVRALDFGHYENMLGTPKLVIDNEFIIISQIKILENLSSLPPGTIVSIHEDSIVIATASYDILLNQVLIIEGKALSIYEFVKRLNLKIGHQFQDVSANSKQKINRLEKEFVKQEKYWVKQLSGLNPISIPYAQNKILSGSPEPKYKSEELLISIEVKTFLGKHPKSWIFNDFIIITFITYLARLSQNSNFDIGLKLIDLKRQVIELEGLFSSILPCRIDLNMHQSFEDIFQTVSQQLDQTKYHKSYAKDIFMRYPKLNNSSNSDWKDLLNTVIIETVQNLENELTNLEGSLILRISEAEGKCTWLYNTEIFDTDRIARMQKQFNTFIKSIVSTPTLSVSKLNLLSEAERHQLLVECNSTQIDYPNDLCIHQLFEQQAQRTPNAIAVGFEEQQLTYLELNQKANQLAHYLQQLGVKPEVLVGICVERSIEMIVGILGILKAGGAYVPLDPTYPTERLGFMLEDTNLSVLLTQKPLQTQLPQHQAQVICLDTDWDKISQEYSEDVMSDVKPENLAYVIYTSGSTGQPKGVMVEHCSVVNTISFRITQQLYQEDLAVVPLTVSISFDGSIGQIFAPLTVGGQLLLVENITHLLASLHQKKVTLLPVVPSQLSTILSEFGLPASVRVILTGAEPVPQKLVRDLYHYSHLQKVINIYGPTEATIFCSAGILLDRRAKISEKQKEQPITIGKPIQNIQIYILDSNLQPLPIGVPGELHVSGVGLARGYLNRPKLTQETFIPNPFGSGRLYKTGDLARYLPDGNIEFIGRIDNQVKIRGFRIELGEIETVLTQHPDIKEAIVIVREDQPGDQRLVAYSIFHSSSPTTTQLRSFLKNKLPEYIIPAAFVELEAFPLTPNGKIDRRALPVPDASALSSSEAYVAPQTPIQKQLATIWSEVLSLEKIGIHDNFFELGGHSLLATQVMSRVQKNWKIEVPLRSLFESPTVADLAEGIENLIAQKSHSSPPAIVAVSRDNRRMKRSLIEE